MRSRLTLHVYTAGELRAGQKKGGGGGTLPYQNGSMVSRAGLKGKISYLIFSCDVSKYIQNYT